MPIMVKKSEHAVCRIVDGEALLLNTTTGEFYALDEIGTKIWNLLDVGKSEDEAATKIANEYATDVETALSDIRALILSLRESGVLE